MPSFGLQATKMLRNSKAFTSYIAPVVTQEQVPEWKRFINETHQQWIDEGLIIAAGDPDYDGILYWDYDNRSTCLDIYTWGGVPVHEPRPDMGFYLPHVMEHPVVTGAAGAGGCPYNFDLAYSSLDMPMIVKNVMRDQRKAHIGPFININFNLSDPVEQMQHAGAIQFYRSLLAKEQDPEEPICVLTMPIFDVLDSTYLRDSQTVTNQDFVGYMGLSIQFRAWIQNILPSKSRGIIVVVNQTCPNTKPFTYRVDGANATYLGIGDHHDPKYNHMAHETVHLQALTDPTMVHRGTTYTGVPLATDICPHEIRIYPSQDMEDHHRTHTPLYLTIIAASIFVFTSVVLAFYDCLVERRQQTVMNRALQSGAIVSSLFPQEVAQKLYEENRLKSKQEEKQRNFRASSTTTGEQQQQQQQPTNPRASSNVNTKQIIAQEHPDCTVFFADLAGFTKWSSCRSPTDVFLLLETLYGAFDAIAARRRVFKIETIGDCYVAITGCPKPQDDHAVIMCRFSQDCMNKMIEITAELADTLGEDTATLGFRVGLHSGPVTAGVLRGNKARFQLFGDTVNTASRMESNGVKGRIHVSQSTADSLIRQGKGDWLSTRADKITAKGKGEMTTYWVTPKFAGTVGTGSVYSSVTSSDPPMGEAVIGQDVSIGNQQKSLAAASVQSKAQTFDDHKHNNKLEHAPEHPMSSVSRFMQGLQQETVTGVVDV